MESRYKELKKRLKGEFLKPIMASKALDYRDSLLIISEPRGGSTWLLELLSSIPKSATIFEPFHSNYGLYFRKDTYQWGTYFEPDHADPNHIKEWQNAISGTLVNPYVVSRSDIRDYMMAEQMVVKMIMGTAFLPWIVQNLDLKYAPIYLLRHPLAVAKSNIENLYKRGKEVYVDHTWIPSGKNKELYEKHKDLFKESNPIIHQLLGRWCVNNYYALRETPDDKHVKVFYEQMLLEPKSVLTALFKSWKLDIPERLFAKIEVPSSSDFKKDFRINKEEQLKKWFDGFSQTELQDMEDILSRFDLKIYSMFDPMPVSNNPRSDFRAPSNYGSRSNQDV